jgi:hypothetical protein
VPEDKEAPLEDVILARVVGNILIFPWMIMPKPCAKSSNTEEEDERYSLS